MKIAGRTRISKYVWSIPVQYLGHKYLSRSFCARLSLCLKPRRWQKVREGRTVQHNTGSLTCVLLTGESAREIFFDTKPKLYGVKASDTSSNGTWVVSPGTFQSQWYRYAVPVRHGVWCKAVRNAIHLCEKRYFFISYIVFHTLYVVYTESNAGTIYRLQRVFFYFFFFIHSSSLLLLFSHHTYALSFFCFCCPFFVVGLSLPAYLLLLLELVAKSNK